jgi:hypothetical protein
MSRCRDLLESQLENDAVMESPCSARAGSGCAALPRRAETLAQVAVIVGIGIALQQEGLERNRLNLGACWKLKFEDRAFCAPESRVRRGGRC